MRWRLVTIGLLVIGGAVGAGVRASARAPSPAPAGAPSPAAACALPGDVFCTVDADCTPFVALCDVTSNLCTCLSADGGVGDLGSRSDLGRVDAATPPSTGGSSNGAPPVVGGGMTAPARNAGCSYIPGAGA